MTERRQRVIRRRGSTGRVNIEEIMDCVEGKNFADRAFTPHISCQILRTLAISFSKSTSDVL